VVDRRECRGRLFMYGYDAGEAGCQDEGFVLMLGRLRNEGFRTPRIGAVSNMPNGVLTIPVCLGFFSPLDDDNVER